MAILRLKEIMKKEGVSREDLAKEVGVSLTTISNISSEKNYPAIPLLVAIAEALDVDIREMFVPTKGLVITNIELQASIDLISQGLEQLKEKQIR